jgi:hypothetical protein
MKKRSHSSRSGLVPAMMLVAGVSCLIDSRAAERDQAPGIPSARCRSIQDPTARLRCYEGAAPSPQVPSSQGISPVRSEWKLLRTPDPRGGTEAVSIIRTPDLARSDPDFAGLMLRCAGTDFEALLVTVRPIPPRTRPGVTLSVGSQTTRFEASVVSPGAAILLPASASTAARGSWQSAAEAIVEIDDGTSPIRGTVSLAGLGSAIATLLANCPRQQAPSLQ